MIFVISREEVMGGSCFDQELEVNMDPAHLSAVTFVVFTLCHHTTPSHRSSVSTQCIYSDLHSFISLLLFCCFQDIIRTVLGNLDSLQPFSSAHFNVFPCILYSSAAPKAWPWVGPEFQFRFRFGLPSMKTR